MIRKTYVLILAAVALATYWNALDAPFVWDDDTAITTNQSIHSIAGSLNPPIETPVSARPIANLSLAVNYAMGELDPFGYHLFNLAVLVASALLLFGIVARTLRRQFSETGGLDVLALVAALIWMVHPLLSEVVDYTTQRTESLMGLFFLLTLYAAIRARGKKRSTRWTVVAIGACALGMATKESMVTAPIAVVLYDVIFEFDSASEAWASRKALYIGLAATWVELGAIVWHWPRSTVGVATVSPVNYLLNQTQMIARYLWLTVWPRALVVDYGLPNRLRLTDVVLPGALVLALLASTLVALRRWPRAGFLGAMFFLTLAPTSSVVPILSEVGAERRMYLPLAAIVVLAVVGAVKIERWGRKWLAVTVVAAIVAVLATRTTLRNRDYESPITLWKSAVDTRPQARSRFGYANQLMEIGRLDEAIAQLRLAVADQPDARAGLGTALLMKGQMEEGISVLEAFVKADPSLPNRAPARALLAQGHRAIAERAMSQQKAAQAAEEARKAVDLDGTSADAHNILGAALAAQGRIAEAIPEFQAAIRLNPQHPMAANNLARALAYERSSGTAKTSK